MDNNIINIILNHWDKIMLLISVLCFFINEMYKSALKKKEIAFSVSHNEVLKSINNYIEAYFNYRTSMKNFPIEFLKPNYPANEIDRIVTTPLSRLKCCDFALSLYLDKKLYSQYNEITKKAMYLKDKLHIILSDKKNLIEYPNTYNKEFTTFEKDVNKLLDNAFEETKLIIWNIKKRKWSINLLKKKKQQEIMTPAEQTVISSSSIPMLVNAITSLQKTINEQSNTIKLLEEKERKLNGELSMLKNERKNG